MLALEQLAEKWRFSAGGWGVFDSIPLATGLYDRIGYGMKIRIVRWISSCTEHKQKINENEN